MQELTLLILAIAILVCVVIVLLIVLRNGKMDLHIRTSKKEDALHIEAEHQDIDK